MHFRLAQFADRQHDALSRYLESDEHARHRELLSMKQRSVQEMEHTITNWKSTGALYSHCAFNESLFNSFLAKHLILLEAFILQTRP